MHTYIYLTPAVIFRGFTICLLFFFKKPFHSLHINTRKLKCTPLKAKRNDGAYKGMYATSSLGGVIRRKSVGPINEEILNLPQILFLLTGVVIPRMMFRNTSRLDFFFDMAEGESCAKLLKAYTELAYAVSHCYSLPQKEKIDNSKNYRRRSRNMQKITESLEPIQRKLLHCLMNHAKKTIR